MISCEVSRQDLTGWVSTFCLNIVSGRNLELVSMNLSELTRYDSNVSLRCIRALNAPSFLLSSPVSTLLNSERFVKVTITPSSSPPPFTGAEMAISGLP